MRIAVVTSDVPFVEGGHLVIARATVKALRDEGHEAELVLTPQNRFSRLFRAYIANRFTDVEEDALGRHIDQVISFRFPSYAVKHAAHVCWLNHRFREYYDLWDILVSQLRPAGRMKHTLRRVLIHALDRFLLRRNVTKLYAQSRTIQERLMRWGRIPSEVLYPPPPPRPYRTDSYDATVLAISRLEKLKRIDLLVEAFRHVKNKDLRAVIIGTGSQESALAEKIRSYGLGSRLSLLGAVGEQVVMDHYARCLAVFFAPLREDYGFVTVEAFACRKPVITTSDSGGPAEIVEHRKSGVIVDPNPERIAEALDELAENAALARQWGEEGHEWVSRLSWETVVQKLVIV
ncbi:MAG: glycosyltransferase family 4 protein [Candidatus Aminicenantales bacterium]